MIPLTKTDRSAHSPLEQTQQVLETLIAAAQLQDGLWPACLLSGSLLPPNAVPAAIPGQREWDRAWSGCNLMHDIPALHLLYALGDGAGYRKAADAYLTTFLERGVHEETGLFYWGEHAFWDLAANRAGNSASYQPAPPGAPAPALIHDHLRQAPPWFWERVAELAPARLQGFADGLERHWISDAHDEYCRHAVFSRSQRYPRWERACDFPRHSGHYVVDLAAAYRALPRPETEAALRRYADYWWEKQDGRCLPMESRTASGPPIRSTSQTLSLGMSLLDAAAVLETALPTLSAELHQRGAAYCRYFLEAPHDLPGERFVSHYPMEGAGEVQTLSLLGSVYGATSAVQNALLCSAAYRVLKEPAFLSWAICIARAEGKGAAGYHGHLPAMDAGLLLELLCDLAELTGDARWLARGREAWAWLSPKFFSGGLVLLADGYDWYEAQQGSGYLLHGAARLGLMLEGGGTIPPDYSAR